MTELKQGTEEWQKARTGLVTGSRAGAILGLSKWADRESVMRDMVRQYFGAEQEFKGNEATEHGNQFEPVAIQDYEIETGYSVDSAGFLTNDDIPWIGVSPDGLINDDGGVEIKCPYRGGIQTLEDKPDYFCQCALSLIVTGREWWDFYVKIYGNGRDEESHLERVSNGDAHKWWLENKGTLKGFYDEYIEIISDKKKAAPYLADLEKDLSDDALWRDAVESYQTAKEFAESANAQLKDAKKSLEGIAAAQGVKKVTGCGVQAYQSTRKGNVQYAKIPELKGVDIEKYRGKESTFWVIK